MLQDTPDLIIYAQHGWADDHRHMEYLAGQLATPKTQIIAPNLGYWRTWLRIAPLIDRVDAIATQTLTQHPHTPMHIIGHSMGGLIWLEVLHRHPEWWPQVKSLTLVGSPVGGADLARIIDPLGWGIGIARDLGKSRRVIGDAIASKIPTLIIRGNINGGSDGTITNGSTQLRHAAVVELPGINHPALRHHIQVSDTIRNFWQDPTQFQCETCDVTAQLIQQLQAIEGMTDAHQRDFYRAKAWLKLPNGITLCTWKNPLGIPHIFVASPQGEYLYGGFVGWLHIKPFWNALTAIKHEYRTS
ncbi:MAG: alpha/beta fold hydrolase [Thermosynechococcaceae cyanobacterium]